MWNIRTQSRWMSIVASDILLAQFLTELMGNFLVISHLQRQKQLISSAIISINHLCIPGMIEGVGPRYCPSIEDKIVKFPDKERHQIFLEPEGIETDEIYVNGFSTSLPFDVQIELGSHNYRV